MRTGATKALLCMLLMMAGVAAASFTAAGQQGQKQQVLQELRTLTARYYSSQQISFDVNYRYSKEESPRVYLDSLQGSYKISGDRYWCSVSNTETIGNKDLTVILFREDKIMYLAKPLQAARSNNPLAMLDSFFVKNDDYDFSVASLPGETRITIAARKRGSFKKMEYFIDKKTGLVTRVANTIDAALLYDETAQPAVEKGANVIVEMTFRNYHFSKPGDDMPDVWKYCKKEGRNYVSLPPYDSYKIFLASPNL